MNLYLIAQDENLGYCTFSEAVVAAENEHDARCTLPEIMDSEGNVTKAWWAKPVMSTPTEKQPIPSLLWLEGSWATSPEKVRVTLLGTAVEGTRAGTISANYYEG